MLSRCHIASRARSDAAHPSQLASCERDGPSLAQLNPPPPTPGVALCPPDSARTNTHHATAQLHPILSSRIQAAPPWVSMAPCGPRRQCAAGGNRGCAPPLLAATVFPSAVFIGEGIVATLLLRWKHTLAAVPARWMLLQLRMGAGVGAGAGGPMTVGAAAAPARHATAGAYAPLSEAAAACHPAGCGLPFARWRRAARGVFV